MSLDDFARTLKLFHVEAPWVMVADISRRVGTPLQDPRSILQNLVRERNKCAHESSYVVSNLSIRPMPGQIILYALSADIAMSIAAEKMRLADAGFYADEKWFTASRIKFRFVQQRGTQWAEVVEGARRASRVGSDLQSVLRNATGSSRGRMQVVVAQDVASQVLDWTYPECP